MRTSRQDYADSNIEEARKKGCDTLQLKYDGWWARTEIIGGEAIVYSRTARPLTSFPADPSITATIIGEYMFGTNWSQKPQLQGKTFAFDLWASNGVDLEGRPYKERYALLKTILPFLPPTYLRVANFNIEDYEDIWRTFVASGEYEGVVFRRRQDTVGSLLLRQKNTITDEYTCLKILKGEGKHAERCGSVIIGDISGRPLFTSDRSPATVGGGWDDDEREDMIKNPQNYEGRRFEVEGKARFSDSGLLRHPNFIRWKDL